MHQYLKYEDIALIPKLGVLPSRSDADVSLNFFGKKFKIPVVPANMKSVINERLSKWMSEEDLFYIMHRFDVDIFNFVQTANLENWKTISISVGVKNEDKKIIEKIADSNLRLDFVTIDIAHGHSLLMKDMISFIKSKIPSSIIIAGNVASYYSILDLAEWGADCVKVGVGQGSPCSTKDKTGFTAPMFTCVKECAKFNVSEAFREIPIIADGGIKCNGDVAKSIVAGATLAMAGSLFSRCSDSPAESVSVGGSIKKRYFGSASEYNKKEKKHIEGFSRDISCNGMSYKDKVIEIEEDLRSAVSYSGGRDLSSLKSTEYILV